MPGSRSSGICVLRVEEEAEHLLITMRFSIRAEDDTAVLDETRHVTRVEDALALVATFLRSFAPYGAGGDSYE